MADDDEIIVQYIILRNDLKKWSPVSITAQACHGSLFRQET